MKRSILSLTCVFILAFAARTQSANVAIPASQTPKAQPTLRAIHQLEALQQRVDLSQEQAISLNSVLLDENIALDSLSQHPTGDQKLDGRLRHDIAHDADVRIYSYLNESQQVQYVLWKQELRIKNLEKKQREQAAADSTRHGPQ